MLAFPSEGVQHPVHTMGQSGRQCWLFPRSLALAFPLPGVPHPLQTFHPLAVPPRVGGGGAWVIPTANCSQADPLGAYSLPRNSQHWLFPGRPLWYGYGLPGEQPALAVPSLGHSTAFQASNAGASLSGWPPAMAVYKQPLKGRVHTTCIPP